MGDLHKEFADDIARDAGSNDPLTTQATVSLAILDGGALPLEFYPADFAWDQVLPAVEQLMQQPSEMRPQLAKALHSHFLEMAHIRAQDYPTPEAMLQTEGEGRGFATLMVPASADDIWALVQFEVIYVDRSATEGAINLIVAGKVAWDMESDVGLFFRSGAEFLGADDPTTFL